MAELLDGEVFTMWEDELVDFFEKALTKENVEMRYSKGTHGVQYYNIPCAFDIETSSFKTYSYTRTGKSIPAKNAIMYIWQFGLNGEVMLGRTWDDFTMLIKELAVYLNLNEKRVLIVYVHNLMYEFQFMHFLRWQKVFSIKSRRPLYAQIGGYEFRCSYLLSGYSLAKTAENLPRYPVAKLEGELDYSLLRTPETPLTRQEYAYCINDVKCVMNYIQTQIESHGNSIHMIPLTKTGEVRRYAREHCFFGFTDNPQKREETYLRYRHLMDTLYITSIDEYKALENAFQGGFTHCNALYSNKVMHDVDSMDITSSYPNEILNRYYPMTSAEFIEEVDYKTYEDYYCNEYLCVATYIFEGLTPRNPRSVPIMPSSKFKTYDKNKDLLVKNNGKILYASRVQITATSIDYLNYIKFYKWKRCRIVNVYYYQKGKLPKNLIRAMMVTYREKTHLKGKKGYESEYLWYKELLNAYYGMMVTAPVRQIFDYDGDLKSWIKPRKDDYGKAIHKYNNSKSRFLFVPWGVFVTAYARDSLYKAILELGDDFVYSDTDCVKFLNYESHVQWFENYNREQLERCNYSCNYYGIAPEESYPKNDKGEICLIGSWDCETTEKRGWTPTNSNRYYKFKSIGAKRYLYLTYGMEYSLTVAGLGKKEGLTYILDYAELHELSPFDVFTRDLHIPAGHTGKQTLTYIDTPCVGTITDYLGNDFDYFERSSVYMEDAHYCASLTEQYIRLLKGVQFIGK